MVCLVYFKYLGTGPGVCQVSMSIWIFSCGMWRRKVFTWLTWEMAFSFIFWLAPAPLGRLCRFPGTPLWRQIIHCITFMRQLLNYSCIIYLMLFISSVQDEVPRRRLEAISCRFNELQYITNTTLSQLVRVNENTCPCQMPTVCMSSSNSSDFPPLVADEDQTGLAWKKVMHAWIMKQWAPGHRHLKGPWRFAPLPTCPVE